MAVADRWEACRNGRSDHTPSTPANFESDFVNYGTTFIHSAESSPFTNCSVN